SIPETPDIGTNLDQLPVAIQRRLSAQHARKNAVAGRQARRQVSSTLHALSFHPIGIAHNTLVGDRYAEANRRSTRASAPAGESYRGRRKSSLSPIVGFQRLWQVK